jgi:hypothetical protein
MVIILVGRSQNLQPTCCLRRPMSLTKLTLISSVGKNGQRCDLEAVCRVTNTERYLLQSVFIMFIVYANLRTAQSV